MSAYLGNRSTIIDLDTTKCIISIVVLGVIGPCMFILQPAYVQGLVQYLEFSEEQAGLIASAEMFGLAAMAIAVNFVLNRINWRLLAILFLIIEAAGNFISPSIQEAEGLMAIRFFTGLGSGGLITITFAMMGLTARSERNIGILVASLLTYGAFGMWIMPNAFHMIGVEGVLIFFGIFSLSGLLFVGNLPCSHQVNHDSTTQQTEYSWSTKFVALSGVLLYNIAIGIVWVYMFLVGIEAGISEQAVANALMISQFLGIAGALSGVIFELRFGRLIPLLIGVLGSGLGIALLLGSPSVLFYAAGVCIFNLLWNLAVVYLMATLAVYDAKGGVVAIGVALQLIGYAAGPAIAAKLLGVGGYDLINSIAIGLFVAAAILLIPGSLQQSKRMANGEAA